MWNQIQYRFLFPVNILLACEITKKLFMISSKKTSKFTHPVHQRRNNSSVCFDNTPNYYQVVKAHAPFATQNTNFTTRLAIKIQIGRG